MTRRPLTAAERKARQRQRERSTASLYSRHDWQLFLDISTLSQKAGCQPSDLRRVVLKELVDNAVDAGSRVSVTWDYAAYVVADDGLGIDPALVPRVFSVNRPLVSSKLIRRPLRGMMGNGLRVVAGAVATSNGSLIVDSKGHRLALRVDDVTGWTEVISDEPIETTEGTTIRIELGSKLRFDGSEIEFVRDVVDIAALGKVYGGLSSPHWYSAKDLHRLFQFVEHESTTVGDVISDLGLEFDDDRVAGRLTGEEAAAILVQLQSMVRPVIPEHIGRIGPKAFGKDHYASKCSATRIGDANIPFAVEAWVSCTRSDARSYGPAKISLYLNRSPSVAVLGSYFSDGNIHLNGCGMSARAKAGKASYDIVVNITTPFIELTNDGKAPALRPFHGAITDAIGKAARAAHRAMEKPPGLAMSIKEAAYSVMVAAYLKASDNNRLPANARQCMYAARPTILKMTGAKAFGDAYFTQTLLPDFIDENPGRTADWDVVYDARGSFTEPHTDCAIPIGTLEIREYLGLRPKLGPAIEVRTNSLFPTLGPKNRYRAVLFVEKEGFDPLFRAAGIAERFDVAIMSTKGMSVVAARSLLDQISPDIDRVLVLHDFDVSGFSIFGTLGSDGRRYVYENKIPIIDIGLRLTDVERMGLEAEPVKVSNWEARSGTLERHGATAAEIAFLADRRVELNAMTSRQFVNFVEQKLIENGVTKVIPNAEVVYAHARRLIEQKLGEEAIDKIREKLAREAASTLLPENLCEQLTAEIERNPSRSWDAALANLIAPGRA